METPAQISQYYEYKNEFVPSSYNHYVQAAEPSKYIITTNAKMCNICEHVGTSNIKECPHVTHHLAQQTVVLSPELTLPDPNQLHLQSSAIRHHQMLEEQQILVTQYTTQDHEMMRTPSTRKRKTPKDEQVTCKICNTVLKNKKGLKMHQQIHDGIKKFLCSNCPKSFLRSNQLKSHQKV